jgi:hypothetical protein
MMGDIMTNSAPLDPQQAFDLASREQNRITGRGGRDSATMIAIWGVVWTATCLAFWLAETGDAVTRGAANAVVLVGVEVAVVASVIIGARRGTGIRYGKGSGFAEGAFGFGSFLAYAGVYLVGLQLTASGVLTNPLVYFPVMFLLVEGILTIVSAAVWRSGVAIASGAVLIVIGVIGAAIPAPAHLLYFAIAGGGALFAGAAIATVRARSGRSTFSPA